MTALAFDTLAYVKRLKAAGVPEAQAEIQAEALAEIVKDQLATKQDLRELELRLETRLAETKAESNPATTPALTRHPSLKRRGKHQALPLSALQVEERELNGYLLSRSGSF